MVQLLWFRFYLENKRQRDEVLHNKSGKTSSGWETIKKGVTQESIHGPLLFFTVQQFAIKNTY